MEVQLKGPESSGKLPFETKRARRRRLRTPERRIWENFKPTALPRVGDKPSTWICKRYGVRQDLTTGSPVNSRMRRDTGSAANANGIQYRHALKRGSDQDGYNVFALSDRPS